MMTGTVLSGRYVVNEIVGTGGMAVVYRAWDKRKKRTVAIKVLRPEFEKDGEFLRRFSREAEAASKMSHENIVSVYDVGMDGDTRYIVMELVDGVTLKDMIREMGHLRSDAVVRMGIRILAAVDHAHKNGIVHRDIKPQNILVNREGKVKVADFGIARLKAQQTTRVDDVNSTALGSVHYLSPEQASGEVADEKSDLYSVGVVLYEMLTGQVPFDGDTAVSVALKHVSEMPKSMRLLDPSIPKAIDEVVMRAMRKDPSERYQTAADMAMDLRKALVHPSGGFVKPARSDAIYSRKKGEGFKNEAKVVDARLSRARRKRRIKYVIIGVLIAFTLFAMAVIAWIMTHVRIPGVSGLSEADAVNALSGSFEVITRHEYSDAFSQGTVINQYPSGGKFGARGAKVVITISDGAGEVEITDHTGQQYDIAMNGLIAEGMNDVTVEYVMSDLEVGTVVVQEPGAGLAQRDTPVVLKVSGETVLAPAVTGYTLDNARASIEAEGLMVGSVSQAYSADAAAGTVIAQSVAPNSEVLRDTEVDLTIAQSQEVMFYPEADFRVVTPLDNTDVRVEVVTPTGATFDAYRGVLGKGTHSVPLSSAESGEHTVSVYLDGELLESMQLTFQ